MRRLASCSVMVAVVAALLVAAPPPPARAAEVAGGEAPSPAPSPGESAVAPAVAASPQEPAPPPAGPETDGRAGRAVPAGEVVAETFTARSVEREYANGVVVARLYTGPTFYEEPEGGWERLDLDLEPVEGEPGALAPAAAPEAAVELDGRLGGAAVEVGVDGGGTVAVEHVDARPVAAEVDGDEAVYDDAYGAGRDLVVRATAAGYEDSLVLDRPGLEGSWEVAFTLPDGVSARQDGPGAVELVGADGAVLARYGDGVAFERHGSGEAAPVAVTLLGTAEARARVAVSADPAWLGDPARRYPVVVDPTYTFEPVLLAHSSGSCEGGATGFYGQCDTYTYSNSTGTTDGPSYPSSAYLRAGRSTSYQYESFLKFATESAMHGSRYRVSSATLRLYALGTSEGAYYYAYSSGSSPRSDMTWDTRPARYRFQSSAWVASTAGWASFAVTDAAQRWFDGSANHGVQVVPSNSEPGSYRSFYSRDTSNSAYHPELTIVYTRPDTPLLSAPADDSRYDTAPPLRARYYDPGGYATGYLDFYLWGTTQAGQSLDRQGQVRATSNGQYLSWDPDSAGAVPAGDYQWFVRANDDRHWSPGGCGRTDGFSCPRSLRVNRLPAAAPLSPAAGARTTDRTPTLSAQYSDPEGRPGGVDIRLFDAAGAQLAPTPHWFSGDGASGRTVYLTTSTLVPGTYSWDLRGWDGRDHSGGFSQRRSFTVDDRAPYKPALLGPGDGATTCDTTPSLSVRYDDPDGDTGGVDMRLFNGAGAQLEPTPWWFSGTGADYRTVTQTRSTALAPGTYSWDVRAWDGYLHSDPDFHAPRWSFAVAAAPGTPASGSLTPLGGGLRVGWNPPTGDGGSPVTGYTVRLYTGTSPTGTPVATRTAAAAARTADFTGLDNATTYSAAVTAGNACGAGGAHDAGTDTPDVKPAAPALVSATGGDGHVALAWDAPAANGGSAVTSYRIRRYTGTAATGTPTVYNDTDGDLRYSAPGTNGQSYTFTVAAVNAEGEGPPSNARTAAPRTVPSQPTQFAVQPGDGKLTASWQPPASDGGSPVTGYDIFVHQGTTLVASDTALTASARSRTFTGLANGTTYTVTLRAQNAAGTGAEATATATPFTTPGAPSNLRVAEGDQQLTASWEPPTVTGGAAVTGYNAYLYQGTTLIASDTTMPETARSKTFTGLTAGTAYTIKVSADNPAGESGTADGTGVPYTKPSAPTLTSATAGDRSVTLDWTAPDDNGRPITRYTIRRYTGTTATGTPVTITDDNSDGDTKYTVTGLTNGQAYTFTVAATNAAGEGKPSNSRTATPFGKPLAPNLTAADPGDTEVTLTWAAPNSNGSPITGYTVRVWQGTAASGTPLRTVGTGSTATAYTVTGLSNGQPYTFTVAASNAAGQGGQSNPRTATPSGKPFFPPAATVDATAGDSAATVTWTAADSNGAGIDRYRVETYRADNDQPQPQEATTEDGAAREATVRGLENNVSYYFKVVARNANGEGDPSARSDTVTPLPQVDLGLRAPDRALRTYRPNATLQGTAEGGAVLTVHRDDDSDGQPDPGPPLDAQELDVDTTLWELAVELREGTNPLVVRAERPDRTPAIIPVPPYDRAPRTPYAPPAGTRPEQAGTVAVKVDRGVIGDLVMVRLLTAQSLSTYRRAFPTILGVADDPTLARWYTATVPPGQEAIKVAEILADPGVETAETVPLWRPEDTPTDPRVEEQYHLERIEAFGAWDHTRGARVDGSPVRVAVLDTGFQLDHPDLVNQLDPQLAATGGCTPSTGDPLFHGTAVAGLIAAQAGNARDGVGVAFDARVVPVRVGEDVDTSQPPDGTADACGISQDWPNALRTLIDDPAVADVQVVNLSFGSYRRSTLAADAVAYAQRSGVLVVASAGNANSPAAHYPSDYLDVVSVTSTDNADRKAASANVGPDIDIAAPGEGLLTTVPGGGMGTISGTSAAAAVVSGLAALTAGQYEQPAPLLAERLLDAADDALVDPHPRNRPQERSEVFGEGHANARRAATGTVTRLGGGNRYETAVTVGNAAVASAAVDTVVLVPGNYPGDEGDTERQFGFRNALPAAGLLGADGSVFVLADINLDQGRLHPQEARDELDALLRDRQEVEIVLAGGPLASFTPAVEDWIGDTYPNTVTRVTGDGGAQGDEEQRRTTEVVGTARALADRIDPDRAVTSAIVVRLETYPDALAMSALAARDGLPLLYVVDNTPGDPNTAADHVPAQTCAWLTDSAVTSVELAGGDKAITVGVEDQLRACKAELTVRRHGGATRIETAEIIARRLFPSPGGFAVANASKWPDAVTGGGLGAAYDAPVLLTNQDGLSAGGAGVPDAGRLESSVADYICEHLTDANAQRAFVLGGVAVIEDDTKDSMARAMTLCGTVWTGGYKQPSGAIVPPDADDIRVKEPEYPVPDDAVHVTPGGHDSTGTGSSNQPYATIGKAVAAARHGGTVVVGTGVYHETVRWHDKQLTLQAAPGAQVWLSGLDQTPLTGWTQEDTPEGVFWKHSWPYPDANECDPVGYAQSDEVRNTAPLPHQLFQDGLALRQVPHFTDADGAEDESRPQMGSEPDCGLEGDLAAQAHERTLTEERSALRDGEGAFVVDEGVRPEDPSFVYVNLAPEPGSNVPADPNSLRMEASQRRVAIRIGPDSEGSSTLSEGSRLLGIGVRQYATYAEPSGDPTALAPDEQEGDSGGAIVIESGGVTVDGVTSALNSATGLYLRGGENRPLPGSVVLNSTFVHNGALGMAAHRTPGLVVQENAFAANNRKGFSPAWAASGLKVTRADGGLARNNLAESNQQPDHRTTLSKRDLAGFGAKGLWWDLECSDWTITGNTVRRNGEFGIFYEVSSNAVIASNLVHDNEGRGIVNFESDNVRIWHNTTVANRENILIGNNDRMDVNNPDDPNDDTGYDPTNSEVMNNVIADATNENSWLAGYQDYTRNDQGQPADRYPGEHFNVRFDGNAYQRVSAGPPHAIPQLVQIWSDPLIGRGTDYEANYSSLGRFQAPRDAAEPPGRDQELEGLESTGQPTWFCVEEEVRMGTCATMSAERGYSLLAHARGTGRSVEGLTLYENGRGLTVEVAAALGLDPGLTLGPGTIRALVETLPPPEEGL